MYVIKSALRGRQNPHVGGNAWIVAGMGARETVGNYRGGVAGGGVEGVGKVAAAVAEPWEAGVVVRAVGGITGGMVGDGGGVAEPGGAGGGWGGRGVGGGGGGGVVGEGAAVAEAGGGGVVVRAMGGITGGMVG